MIKVLLSITLLFTAQVLFSQGNRSQLEQERLELIRKIENSTQELSAAKENKSSILSQINALEIEIDAREKLITNLEVETNLIEDDITATDVEIESVTTLTEPLIEEYYELLRVRYRNKLLTKNYLSLWNSKKVSELITKWRVFKNFESILLAKGNQLHTLDNKNEKLIADKAEQQYTKEELLTREKNQLDSLTSKKATLMNLAKNLTFKERSALSKLSLQKIAREEYNRAIESSIKGAIHTGAPSSSNPTTTTIDFSKTGIAAKQGFLPWPLSKSVITKRYGPQNHPSVSDIKITNHGVDVSSEDPTTRSIFAGKVISISMINNQGQTVIVQHDSDYYSVYTNLRTVSIKQDETISQGQVIGAAGKDSNGKAALHFEFWNGKKNLNPKHWLKNN